MANFLQNSYLWIKAFHIISVISWMAAMLYLPRLYVYHCEASVGSEFSEKLKIMEYRLLKYIMTPAMIATYLSGIGLIFTPGLVIWSEGWVHAKFFLVLLLTATHGLLAAYRKDFQYDQNKHTQKFYRVLNEVPTILMIGIVILVITKPF